jgi:predicted phosphate transport protein (TIGR00153 family)
VLSRLLPRETSFFDYFDKHAALTVAGAKALQSLVSSGANLGPKAKRIKEIEHEADVITHQCIEALHTTFITPIERSDVHQLISRMDDVVDFIEAAADRLVLYELETMTDEVKDMSDTLVRATLEVEQAVRALRDMRNAERIRQLCVEVNRLENEADAVLRNALAKLFRTEQNAITVIKWKEIYELIEEATDRCEDIANTIEGVVLENA